MDKTENTLNDNINELNTYNHIIQSKILLLNKLSETVNVYLMRKNELSLINFYTENKNKILSQTEFNEINDINELNLEGMSNLKIDIDKLEEEKMTLFENQKQNFLKLIESTLHHKATINTVVKNEMIKRCLFGTRLG